MRIPLPFALQITGGRLASPDPAAFGVALALGVSSDTRDLAPGALFAALSGPTHDGHHHVGTAFQKGAVAALVRHEVDGAAGHQIVVPDVLAALQELARAMRLRWNGQVIGITGSAGKTTTKDAVAAVLSTAAPTGKTLGNFNNHIGVPLSLLNLPDDARYAVIELGMNHAGEIRHLAGLARPDHAVVTNVGSAHIQNFDSIDAIAAAKRELVEALPPGGTAILNYDDERVRAFASTHPGPVLTFGTLEGAGVRAEDIRYTENGSEFRVRGLGDFSCPLPARGGISSSLAALAVARALHLSSEPLREAVRSLQPPKMRLERLERNGMTIWNDCYNSNPEAAKMMLDLLAATPAQRRIAVLGEMLELGRWSEELHRDVGLHVARCGITVLVGIRGAACHLVDAARGAGLTAGAAYFFDEPSQAGAFLKSFALPGDTLLFKGSRGTRVEIALEELLR
jgi:UDP-N-acetylmuramoyl-tripeptide--D-alanyl-D-alanine ligase